MTPWRNPYLATDVTASTSITRVTAIAGLIDRLKDIPRRVGELLFMSTDEEAHWRGWQITRTYGGLGRVYRDPRFDTLRASGANADGDSPLPLGGQLAAQLPPDGER